MSRWLTSKRLLVALMVGLVLLSLLETSLARKISRPLRHLTSAAVGLLGQKLKIASDAVSRPEPLAIDRGDPARLQQSYHSLLSYNAWLLEELKRSRQELAQYKAFSQRFRMDGLKFLDADVTAWNRDSRRRTMALNRGTTHGLAVGQVVTDWSSFSLLGRICDAGPVSSTVQLIDSPDTDMEVRFLPSAPVRLENPTTLRVQMNPQGQFTALTPANRPIQVGYLAHLSDPSWPQEARGFVVGQVVSLENDPKNPHTFKRVVIRPVQDLAFISRVIVLSTSPPSPPSSSSFR